MISSESLLSEAERSSMADLLHDQERDYLREKGREHGQERVARIWAGFLNQYVIASAMLLLYTMLLLLLVPWLRREKVSLGTGGIYSPANEAVHYQEKLLHNSVDAENPYKGPPSPKTDDAWNRLFKNANIRLSSGEMQLLGRTSVPFADGTSDFLGTLDIYHQLHCLKYIRHFVHRDYYKLRENVVTVDDHVDHCIDSLRQLIMCRGDVTVQTYTWRPDLLIPWANFEVAHECIDFEAVDSWSKERAIDIRNPNYLVHPTLGPVVVENYTHGIVQIA